MKKERSSKVTYGQEGVFTSEESILCIINKIIIRYLF